MTESELNENCIRLRTYITPPGGYTDVDVTKEAIVQHFAQDGNFVTLTAEAHDSLRESGLVDEVMEDVQEPAKEHIVRNEWDE